MTAQALSPHFLRLTARDRSSLLVRLGAKAIGARASRVALTVLDQLAGLGGRVWSGAWSRVMRLADLASTLGANAHTLRRWLRHLRLAGLLESDVRGRAGLRLRLTVGTPDSLPGSPGVGLVPASGGFPTSTTSAAGVLPSGGVSARRGLLPLPPQLAMSVSVEEAPVTGSDHVSVAGATSVAARRSPTALSGRGAGETSDLGKAVAIRLAELEARGRVRSRPGLEASLRSSMTAEEVSSVLGREAPTVTYGHPPRSAEELAAQAAALSQVERERAADAEALAWLKASPRAVQRRVERAVAKALEGRPRWAKVGLARDLRAELAREERDG